MCNPEEYELHTVIFPFAQQYFEWWWCNLHNNILNCDGTVPMFTFFLAFANLGAHVSSTIIPVLPSWESSYCIDKRISTSIFFACVHNTVFTWPVWITCTICVMKGRVQLGSRWRKLSLILVQREMGYKETLRERSQWLDKVTKGWSAKYWTKKQSRPSALPWISNSLQCSRPSYLTEDRRVLKKIP